MKRNILILFLFLTIIGKGTTITSTVGGGSWNSPSTWIGGIGPGNNDDAIIAGPVTCSMGGTVHNITVNASVTFTVSGSLLVYGAVTNHGTISGGTHLHYIGATITSTTGGGDWATAGTWVGGVIPDTINNVVINGPVTISASDPAELCSSLTINSGKTFTVNHSLQVWGSLINNGTLAGNTAILYRGTNITIISGTGSFTSTGALNLVMQLGSDTIASNVSYTSTANIAFVSGTVNANMILVNMGSVVLTGSATVGNTGTFACKWINGPNSTLEVSANLLANSYDTLVASASGNLIEYAGSSSYSIKKPLNSQYYDVTIVGSAVVLGGDYNYHTLTANSGASFNMGGHNASLTGNWVNHGTISNNTGTVTFDAVGSQCVLRTSGTEAFKNITITRTSKLGTNCTVSASGTVYMQPGGSM
ncbi:MAG TPA: hypothetical protein VNZ45_14130, partial [Bacteroidia bacterium]|nr:hypothetical protein [Bacteroidia bacterium]